MQLTLDVTALQKYGDAIRSLGETGLASVLVSRDLIAKVRVYLTAEMDRALQEMKGLKEGQSATIRGQEIKGWASRSVRKYGDTVIEGTRFRFRKARRDGGLSAMKAKEKEIKGKEFRTAQEVKDLGQLRKLIRQKSVTATGTIGARGKARDQWESKRVKDRPFEKVWNKRASGKPYSESSELLRDTGAMSRAWGNIQTTVVTGKDASVTFKPGTQISYFNAQNAMRPIFVFDNPKDEEKILSFVDAVLQKMIDERLGRTT
jgi:hypothetical protein